MTRRRFQLGVSWWLVPVAALAWVGWARGVEEKKGDPPKAEAKTKPSAGSYWLGVLCAPVDALLRTHLKLDAGVVVEQVVPDSPAAKAGIRENDILLRFGDVKLTDVECLMKTVAKNQDREAKLSLLREGKETTLSVRPAERPAEGIALPPTPGAGDWGQISDWMLKRLERGQSGRDPMSMFFMHPGVIVPKEFKDGFLDLDLTPPATVQLPKNTSVTITLQGDQPAKIVVQQGEQKWEVNENELDKLPERLRPSIRTMLGGNARVYMFGQGPVVMPWFRQEAPADPSPRKAEPEKKREGNPEATAPDAGKVREKLDEMTRQLQENEKKMQRQLDELRQQLEKLKQQQI